MPLQNRVQPDGQIIAHPARGLFMGNRGILHDDEQKLGTARWRHPHWVTCVLQFKGRHRPVMAPHAYTELFFLDEAVALAAGHRPCAECRRTNYRHFRTAWDMAFNPISLADLDKALHASRADGIKRTHRIHAAKCLTLPDGCFVKGPDGPALVWGPSIFPYHPAGYGPALPRPTGPVQVFTPAVTVAVLRAGYRPEIHPSAATAGQAT